METPCDDAPRTPRSPSSLVPRWLAAAVLAAVLAAGAVSAWLLVNADLSRAERPAAGAAGPPELR